MVKFIIVSLLTMTVCVQGMNEQKSLTTKTKKRDLTKEVDEFNQLATQKRPKVYPLEQDEGVYTFEIINRHGPSDTVYTAFNNDWKPIENHKLGKSRAIMKDMIITKDRSLTVEERTPNSAETHLENNLWSYLNSDLKTELPISEEKVNTKNLWLQDNL